jgi:hypothetical protein
MEDNEAIGHTSLLSSHLLDISHRESAEKPAEEEEEDEEEEDEEELD